MPVARPNARRWRRKDSPTPSWRDDDDDDGGDAALEKRDPLFRKAAETCIQHQLGSTSLLQRRLGIGYGRAARVIDQLHAAGVLGPPNGSKPRDILVGFDDLDRIAGPDAG
jgi:S-DNA-T family DNA segregation ATPase FtsK/SpoIIIE